MSGVHVRTQRLAQVSEAGPVFERVYGESEQPAQRILIVDSWHVMEINVNILTWTSIHCCLFMFIYEKPVDAKQRLLWYPAIRSFYVHRVCVTDSCRFITVWWRKPAPNKSSPNNVETLFMISSHVIIFMWILLLSDFEIWSQAAVLRVLLAMIHWIRSWLSSITSSSLKNVRKSSFYCLTWLLLSELDQVPLPSRDGRFEDFLDFCQTNGVDVSAVEICKSMFGYGLRAKKEITENELMITIPRQMLLTVEHQSSEVPFTTFISQDPLLKEMPNLLLAMIVIREYCDPNSRWKPYFNILPETYETPLYFDRETLWSLKPSSSFHEAGKLIRNIGRQYAYFWTKMVDKNHVASQLSFRNKFTFQIYRWDNPALTLGLNQ